MMENEPAINNPIERHEFRAAIMQIQDRICNLPEALVSNSPEGVSSCPVKHTFVDNAYVREIFMPKDMVVVSKIHKKTHPYFIMKGDVSVLTEEGIVRLKAPFAGITKAGTKRLLYTHEDTVWITVHATNEIELPKIEDEIIAKDFDELDGIIDIEHFLGEVTK